MRATVMVGLVMALLAQPAYGQDAPWRLIGASDGTLYIVADGVRHQVIALSPPDDQIATIPLGDAWGYSFSAGAVAPAAPIGVRQIGAWKGAGQKVTEPITVTGAAWRLNAMVTGQLCITIYRLPHELISAGCLKQSDTTYVYSGAGSYYLELSSINPWAVVAEEGF